MSGLHHQLTSPDRITTVQHTAKIACIVWLSNDLTTVEHRLGVLDLSARVIIRCDAHYTIDNSTVNRQQPMPNPKLIIIGTKTTVFLKNTWLLSLSSKSPPEWTTIIRSPIAQPYMFSIFTQIISFSLSPNTQK